MTSDTPDPIKEAIQTWIQGRHEALLEQIMMTWEEGVRRFNPDDSLMRSLRELMPAPTAPPPPTILAETESDLGQGLDLIESATSQGEVLKRLLEGLQPFAERSALFVIKQGIASLYTARGFEPPPAKNTPPVVPPPELDELIQGRRNHIDNPGPAYSALVAPLSRFEASGVRLFALRLRRKTVAILLVDSGLRHVIDHPNHIRALTHAAEVTLAVLAGAKEEERTQAPVEASPSSQTMLVPEVVTESLAAVLDPKIRANAERSARVLVGDIELYFPAKVAQGRQMNNMYGLLKEELDRSRAAFIDRYGADVENQHRIFYQTVVSNLCEGSPTKLGPAPWAPKS